jgi:hypothetical protein
MNKRNALVGFAGSILLCAGVLLAQAPPPRNVGARHPNLAAAQRLLDQAFQRITEAQRANEWDLGGHAEKAKGLLDEASRELKLAAETANKDRR